MRPLLATITFVCLSSLLANQAKAAIVIQMREVSNDVVFTYQGSLDLTGENLPGLSFNFPGVSPSTGEISFALPGGSPTERYASAVLSAPSFGSGTGTPRGDFQGDPLSLSSTAITTPRGYVNDSAIAGTMAFRNNTFATLGIDASSGPYIWTLNSGDTVTLTAIPEPSSSAAFLALSSWFATRRRRR